MSGRADERSGDEREEQQSLQGADEEQRGNMKWYAYCPMGDLCSKKGRTLGGFWSEARARDAIFTHLRNSPYHGLSKDEAMDAADVSELQCHDWAEEDEVEEALLKPKTQPRRPRSPERMVADSRKRARHTGSASSSSGVLVRGGGVAAPASLDQAIRDQTKNAIIFTRSMAKAEKALRLAAKVSRSAMETFQDRVLYKCFESRARVR